MTRRQSQNKKYRKINIEEEVDSSPSLNQAIDRLPFELKALILDYHPKGRALTLPVSFFDDMPTSGTSGTSLRDLYVYQRQRVMSKNKPDLMALKKQIIRWEMRKKTSIHYDLDEKTVCDLMKSGVVDWEINLLSALYLLKNNKQSDSVNIVGMLTRLMSVANKTYFDRKQIKVLIGLLTKEERDAIVRTLLAIEDPNIFISSLSAMSEHFDAQNIATIFDRFIRCFGIIRVINFNIYSILQAIENHNLNLLSNERLDILMPRLIYNDLAPMTVKMITLMDVQQKLEFFDRLKTFISKPQTSRGAINLLFKISESPDCTDLHSLIFQNVSYLEENLKMDDMTLTDIMLKVFSGPCEDLTWFRKVSNATLMVFVEKIHFFSEEQLFELAPLIADFFIDNCSNTSLHLRTFKGSELQLILRVVSSHLNPEKRQTIIDHLMALMTNNKADKMSLTILEYFSAYLSKKPWAHIYNHGIPFSKIHLQGPHKNEVFFEWLTILNYNQDPTRIVEIFRVLTQIDLGKDLNSRQRNNLLTSLLFCMENGTQMNDEDYLKNLFAMLLFEKLFPHISKDVIKDHASLIFEKLRFNTSSSDSSLILCEISEYLTQNELHTLFVIFNSPENDNGKNYLKRITLKLLNKEDKKSHWMSLINSSLTHHYPNHAIRVINFLPEIVPFIDELSLQQLLSKMKEFFNDLYNANELEPCIGFFTSCLPQLDSEYKTKIHRAIINRGGIIPDVSLEFLIKTFQDINEEDAKRLFSKLASLLQAASLMTFPLINLLLPTMTMPELRIMLDSFVQRWGVIFQFFPNEFETMLKIMTGLKNDRQKINTALTEVIKTLDPKKTQFIMDVARTCLDDEQKQMLFKELLKIQGEHASELRVHLAIYADIDQSKRVAHISEHEKNLLETINHGYQLATRDPVTEPLHHRKLLGSSVVE